MEHELHTFTFSGEQNYLRKRTLFFDKTVGFIFLICAWVLLTALFLLFKFHIFWFLIGTVFVSYSLILLSHFDTEAYSWQPATCTTTFTFTPTGLQLNLSFKKKRMQNFKEFSCLSKRATNTQKYDFSYEHIKKVYWYSDEACFIICYDDISSGNISSDIPSCMNDFFYSNPYSFFCERSMKDSICDLFIEHTNAYVQNAPISQILHELHM